MRILFAILISAAVHALLIVLTVFYFDFREDPDKAAKLDLSSVELSLQNDEVELKEVKFDEPPALSEPTPPDSIVNPGALSVQASDYEVAVTVPEAEPLKIPVAEDPVPPKMDMPEDLKKAVRKVSAAPVEKKTVSAAKNESGSSGPSRPSEISPVKVRVEAKLKNNFFREPEYPRASRRRGEKGEVRLKLGVNVRGLVESVEVVGSTGFKLLDDAAVKAAKAARFIPATIDGEAVFSTTEIKIVFKLN